MFGDVPRLVSPAGGGGATIGLVEARVTSGTAGGDTPPDTSGAWQILAGPGGLEIDAAVGDQLEFTVSFLAQDSSGTLYDIAVDAGGTRVWHASSGTGTPALEGDPSMYPVNGALTGRTVSVPLVVESGHLDGGSVRWVLAVKSNNTGKTYYSSSYPLRWHAINYGAAV